MPVIKCYILPVTSFQQNCSIVVCEKSQHAAVIDPGGDVDQIVATIEKIGVTTERILLTHGHIDHVGGTAELSRRLDLPIEGPHEGDRPMLERFGQGGRSFGMGGEPFEPDRWLAHGDIVEFGEQQMEVMHCPGHTPGHVVFYHREDNVAFVGDVLFQGSIGRTDFPGGSYEQLIQSITRNLWPLGEEVTFIPGHGPLSTFGNERLTNPFVADAVLSPH